MYRADYKSKQLQVDYLFYKDFSKWLRRESLRKVGGVSGATQRILTEVATTKLKIQDIKILLSFGCPNITRTVFYNKFITPYQKYRYILKYNITEKRAISNASTGVPKLKERLMAHWNTRFLKNKTPISFDTLEDLIEKKERTLPLVQNAVLCNLIEGSFYDWQLTKQAILKTMSLDQQIKEIRSILTLAPTLTKITRVLKSISKRSYLYQLSEPIVSLATNLISSCSYDQTAVNDLCIQLVELYNHKLVTKNALTNLLDKVEVKDTKYALGFLLKELQDSRTNVIEENTK